MYKSVYFLIAILFFGFTALAQEIPVTQEDRNTFTFSTENFVLVKDFELLNAEPQKKENHYLLTIRALTPDKETDESISGYLLFEIEENPVSIQFLKGLAQHAAIIQNPNEFTVTAVDSRITKTFQVQEPVQWYWVFLIIPALLVIYIIFRKINSKRKVSA